MEFTYNLVGLGWAEAELVDDAASATITASYLTDALADLLETVAGLLTGAWEGRCSWEEEPGEYRWTFQQIGGRVDLRVLWFDDVYDEQPDERGRIVFATQQPLHVLASAIADGAARVLAEYGQDGYRERWHLYPFPTGLLTGVQDLLDHE